MPSRGYHPHSDYMMQPGKTLYAMSSLDILIDIAGILMKMRSIKPDKAINNTDEYATGSHLAHARVTHDIKYTGAATFASFLIDGTPALTTHEYLTLQSLLFDQNDEGEPVYFDIHILEVPGKHTAQEIAGITGGQGGISQLGYIEALINCKVDKFNREYPEKNTIVSSFDFGYLRKVPQ